MSSTYIVRMGLLPYYKVGSTKWNVDVRIAALQTGNPFPLELVAVIPGRAWERRIHEMWDYYRVRGEWFEIADPQQVVEVAAMAGSIWDLWVRAEHDVGVVFYGTQELVRGDVHHVEPLRAVS